MNRRKSDRWSHVFVLLIFVMVAVLAAERILDGNGLGIENVSLMPSTTPSLALPEATITADDNYPFLPPTQEPVTPSLTPTPVLTPTPPALLVEVSIINFTPQAENGSVPRATPIGAASSVIARCLSPGKQGQYVLYDLASTDFRLLSDSFSYLVPQTSISAQAYAVGAIQKGLSLEEFATFPISANWTKDQNYTVLGVSSKNDAMLVQRFGKLDPGIYWLNKETQESRLIFNWSGILSETQAIQQLNAVLLQFPDEQNVENLFLVKLDTGAVEWLTQYESLSTKNGRISPNGRRLAYWTDEGVWLVLLDGTFSSLSFPNASYPGWASDSSRLTMVLDGRVMVSNFDGSNLEPISSSNDGMSPQWVPDGTGIVYWRKADSVCEWRYYNVDTGKDKTLLKTTNKQCQPESSFTFSSDGQWLLGMLAPGTEKSEKSGAVVCDLHSGICKNLSYSTGNTCDQAVWSTQKLPFEWDFTTDTDGWWLIQQVQDLGVGDGIWTLISTASFPVIASPVNLGINTDMYPFLEITLRIDKGTIGTIYIVTDDSRQYDDRKSFKFNLIADGEFHRYRFDLRDWTEWNGVMNGLRIRLTDSKDANILLDQVKIFTGIE